MERMISRVLKALLIVNTTLFLVTSVFYVQVLRAATAEYERAIANMVEVNAMRAEAGAGQE